LKKKRLESKAVLVNVVIEYKQCCSCKITKHVSEFHKRGKNSYKHNCKTCRKEEASKRYVEKKDHILEVNNKWKEENKERYDFLHTRWKENNREKMREVWRNYNKRNPSKCNANNRKYFASKLQAIPLWIEISSIKLLYKEASELSLEVDHVVPLRSKYVCGLHCLSNLQLLTKEENRSKNNRYWPDMWEYGLAEKQLLHEFLNPQPDAAQPTV